MNARALNTLRRGWVAVAAAGAVVLAGCGGSSVSSVLHDAFHPAKPITSGKLNLSFGVTATGLASARQPVSMQIQGPFETTKAGQLPKFSLSVTLNSGGRSVNVGATATGSQLFLELQGTPYLAPDSVYQQFKQSYAQSSSSRSRQSATTFVSLGIDPGSWLSHPREVGTATVGGVTTIHISATLNVPRFLADLGRVSGSSSSLGLGAGLNSSQRAALGRSVTSARADVYVGRDDHVLRRLIVHADLAAPSDASTALGGLKTGTLDFGLGFDDVNRPQAIAAPANAQPLSSLTAQLQQLGASGSGSSGASSSGAGPSAPATTGSPAAAGASGAASAGGGSSSSASGAGAASGASGQQAYLQCAQQAGQDLAALQKCAPLLKGG